MGFFDKLKSYISKDSKDYLEGFKDNNIGTKLNKLKNYYKKLDDDFLEELMIILLEADVGINTAELICEKLKAKCNQYVGLSFNDVIDNLIETMNEIYNIDEYNDQLIFNEDGPTIIMMVGINGAGKTTTIPKLASKLIAQNKKVALVAADTFRAGATAQLLNWANKLNIDCITGKDQQDPSSVLVNGCQFAKENNIDVLICDTSGRLQNKVNLMKELEKMTRVIGQQIPNAPHNTILVIDSTTGQNGISQATSFNETTKLTGVILTKMDGTSKGGIVLAIKNITKVPVLYLGLGEQIDDLKEFDLNLYLYGLIQGLNYDNQ